MQTINKLIELSENAFSKQEFDKALGYISKAFEEDSDVLESYNWKLYHLKGKIYGKQGRYYSNKDFLQKALNSFSQSKSYQLENPTNCIEIAKIYIFQKQFTEAENILEKALISSQENQNIYQEIGVLNTLVQLHIEKRNLIKAEKLSDEVSLLINYETPDELIIEYFQSVMTINIRTHNFTKVAEIAEKSFRLCRSLNNIEGEIKTLNAIGIVHAIKGEYKQAFEVFWKSHDKSLEIDFRLMTARTLINIGNIFSSLYNYEEARRQHSKVLNDYLDQIDTFTYVVLCHNLGGTNIHLGNDKEALEYFLQGLETAKNEKNYNLQAALLYEISKLYSDIDLEKALEYVQQTQAVLENNNINSGVESNVINLAEIYFKQKKYEAALEKGLESLELCKGIKNKKTLVRVYKLLSQVYKILGFFEKSLNFYELYHGLQTELHQEMRKKQTLELEIRYDLKEKENEIKLLKTDMELQKVELEFANEIAAQSELIKQANESIKQFTYAVSHDLKEPLRMIGSFTSLIGRKVKKFDDSTLNEYMGFVTDGVERMTAMLNGMLDYARVGQHSYTTEEVDLMQIVSDVILTLRVSVQENNADITFDEMPTLTTNKVLISQLFQNLIGNAIKFRKKDVDPKIHVAVKDENKRFVFSVQDNGIGIADDKKEKVFDLFTRLHTKEEYEGTGIGLAMCKKIIQILHGEIWIESEYGIGTTFNFSIPKTVLLD